MRNKGSQPTAYSFDDNAIGKLTASGQSLASRVIERPAGVDRQSWYLLAGSVCQLLNADRILKEAKT